MAIPKKKDNRGGARPGAGRPKQQSLTVQQVEQMLKRAKAFASKHGKTIDDILLEFIYGQTEIAVDGNPDEVKKKAITTRDRIACIKLFKEYTAPKLREGGEADQSAAVTVYLPEHRNKVVQLVKE